MEQEIEQAEPEAQAARIPPDQFIAYVTQAENLAAEMGDEALKEIARDVCDYYEADKSTMDDWLDRMKKAIELAKLVKEEKDYPFPKSANIKYPMVTTAALQFNARAYPAIVPPTDMVKAKVWGGDPSGQKAARGKRVAEYMSWQLSTEVEEWERETDKLTVLLPIVGDMFRKVWWDGRRIRCKLVEPGKFIVNAKAQSINDAPRVSEEMSLYPHEIKERINSGFFVDFEYDEDPEDKHAAQLFIEQHCRLDLDEDGYTEPYVVTVHHDTQTVVHLVADFEPADVDFETEQRPQQAVVQTPMGPMLTMEPVEVAVGIKSIRRNSYYVHYQFMPGMDGCLLGTGLGILLGDISETVNSTINMMLDASHFASLGGGFIGSEFRLKGGAQRMRPGEWRKVEARGGDVRSAMVPMTFPGADAVLFQLLGLLIEAGKEISSTKDILTGDSGTKNMTATTTLALIEQGMKVFTAAYKRIFLGLKREFAMVAKINATTVDPRKYNMFLDGEQQYDPREEFSLVGMDIQPVADPNAVTKMQEMAKAQLLMELAQAGQVSAGPATARILEAASIDGVEDLVPQPDPMQQQMAAMQMQAAQADLAQKMADIELTMAKVQSERTAAVKDVADVQSNERAQRFDEIMRILETQRDDLARELTASRGGVERAPGNGGIAARADQTGGAAAGGGNIVLLGGQGPIGGGSAVMPSNGILPG